MDTDTSLLWLGAETGGAKKGDWRGEPYGASRCRCLCRMSSESIGEKRRRSPRTCLKPETSVHGEKAEELTRIRPQGESAWANQPPGTDVGGAKAGIGFVGVRMTQTTTQEAVRVNRHAQIFLTPMARPSAPTDSADRLRPEGPGVGVSAGRKWTRGIVGGNSGGRCREGAADGSPSDRIRESAMHAEWSDPTMQERRSGGRTNDDRDYAGNGT